jgi:hypothetical protein
MRLAILGASGHGKVVADAAGLAGWDEVVFFDDAWPGLTQNGEKKFRKIPLTPTAREALLKTPRITGLQPN